MKDSPLKRSAALSVAALCASMLALPALAQSKLSAMPALPAYGMPVQVELQDADWPMYLPATRYTLSGTSVVIDYEYVTASFGPYSPDFGNVPLNLGELPPGNYTVQARLHDIARPSAAPTTLQGTIAVVPPGPWGIYTIPAEPQAFGATQVLVKSAAYFDPASMRASLSGSVLRVDFNYLSNAPASGAAPDGMRTYGSVKVPALQPGSYRIEGWGSTNGGAPEKFFTRELAVASTTPVVEFYSASLDHYFIASGADEIALLDRGAQGDWKRTGYGFKAWTRASDAPPGAVAVCRFYARGPNSHFFTGSRQECDYLRTLEQQQRADAAASGKAFLGWGYEGIAFYALVPVSGQCGAATTPVYRIYNNRAAQMDSNHRFTIDRMQESAMAVEGIDEGAQLCSPL
jgi:hypothetical protein